MRMLLCASAFLMGLATRASAGEYYNKKWFDYPDPLTAPKFENGCANWIKTSSVSCHWLKCHHIEAKICTNPTHIKVALLRKDVYVVVSGPDTSEDAVRRTIEGVAAGCAATALAAAGTPSPASVGAPAVFFAAFKACVLGVSASGVAGGIIRQLGIRIDSSRSHWSPV